MKFEDLSLKELKEYKEVAINYGTVGDVVQVLDRIKELESK